MFSASVGKEAHDNALEVREDLDCSGPLRAPHQEPHDLIAPNDAGQEIMLEVMIWNGYRGSWKVRVKGC